MANDDSELLWNATEELLTELVQYQQKKVIKRAQEIVPNITEDDILQPNDFPFLEQNPLFRYEEGVLAGIQSAQMALRAFKRERQCDESV